MCICGKNIPGGRNSKSKGSEARGGQEASVAGAKWGWDERGAEVRADGVGERIVGGGMEDEGREGRGPYGPW